MSFSSLSNFGAAGPMVGYLYQVRIALLWAIRRSRDISKKPAQKPGSRARPKTRASRRASRSDRTAACA